MVHKCLFFSRKNYFQWGVYNKWIKLWFMLIPLLFLMMYYWIAVDEMKGQHPVRRTVWLMLVPLSLVAIPISFGLSVFPMVFSIVIGESFDKPKPAKETEIDIKVAKFVSKNVWARALWLTIALSLLLLLFHPLF